MSRTRELLQALDALSSKESADSETKALIETIRRYLDDVENRLTALEKGKGNGLHQPVVR